MKPANKAKKPCGGVCGANAGSRWSEGGGQGNTHHQHNHVRDPSQARVTNRWSVYAHFRRNTEWEPYAGKPHDTVLCGACDETHSLPLQPAIHGAVLLGLTARSLAGPAGTGPVTVPTMNLCLVRARKAERVVASFVPGTKARKRVAHHATNPERHWKEARRGSGAGGRNSGSAARHIEPRPASWSLCSSHARKRGAHLRGQVSARCILVREAPSASSRCTMHRCVPTCAGNPVFRAQPPNRVARAAATKQTVQIATSKPNRYLDPLPRLSAHRSPRRSGRTVVPYRCSRKSELVGVIASIARGAAVYDKQIQC